MIPITSDPTLGQRIKVIRTYRGLSQKQLSEILQVSQGMLSHWEQGRFKPDWDMCRAICELTKFKESFLAEAYDKLEDQSSQRRRAAQIERMAKTSQSQVEQLPLSP